jgi:hypothetical protein
MLRLRETAKTTGKINVHWLPGKRVLVPLYHGHLCLHIITIHLNEYFCKVILQRKDRNIKFPLLYNSHHVLPKTRTSGTKCFRSREQPMDIPEEYPHHVTRLYQTRS